jgi:transposase
MERLEHVSLEELRDQLKETDEKVPAQRLLAAIGRKQGDTLATLAERHDVTEKTIQNWLDRFEDQPVDQAPYDEERAGRPPKLTDEQRDEFYADLHRPPDMFGYERSQWTPELAHRHLQERYDVEYSVRHVRRMINRADVDDDSPVQL